MCLKGRVGQNLPPLFPRQETKIYSAFARGNGFHSNQILPADEVSAWKEEKQKQKPCRIRKSLLRQTLLNGNASCG